MIRRGVALFASYPEIKAAYLFGSVAEGTQRQSSDVDFAVLCQQGLGPSRYGELQVELNGKLSSALGTDNFDVVVLNATQNIELKYNVIQDGRIIFDRSDDLAEFEIRVSHEYQDHMSALRRHGLTKG